MSYKTIVVLVERAWRPEQFEVAFALAREMDAHVVGLHSIRPNHLPAHVVAEAGPAGESFREMERIELARREEKAHAAFESTALRSGLRTIEWRTAHNDPLEAAALSARYADLLIAAQPAPGPDDTGATPQVHHALALVTGRPVLFVPYAGQFRTVGKRILIAWNASREAARAVSDSLPLLRRADKVSVLVVDPGDEHGEMPGADVGLFLARHGVKIDIVSGSNAGVGIGEVILSRAADADADLIVMGAYGHSRIRELILGGATRTLLGSMTVPVLMSH